MNVDLSSAIPSFGSPTLQGFDTSNLTPNQRIGGVSNRQYVRFFKEKFRSNAVIGWITDQISGQRKPKFEVKEVEREMVHIKTPGDKNEVVSVAEDWHKRNFWNQYSAFRAGRTAPIGTPIDECSYISPHIATELLYLGVRTEEQLADAADVLCQQIPDGYNLRELAIGNCKVKAENANPVITSLQSELRQKDELIARLLAQSQPESTGAAVMDSAGLEPGGEIKEVVSPRRRKSVNLEA